MRRISDPTAARAIGAVDREWRYMIQLAYRIRTEPATATKYPNVRRLFTGTYKRLMTDPLDELREQIPRKIA